MRHAKSDWSYEVDDIDRPLNDFGTDSALKKGIEFKKVKLMPDLIMSSPANRAYSTAQLFAKNLGYSQKIDICNEFYNGTENGIIARIAKTSDEIKTLMIVGHNPTWENLTYLLCNEKIFISFQTACIAVLISEINTWKEVKQNIFKIEYLFNRIE